MDWAYLIQAGKEGFRERVWVHGSATMGTTVGVAVNTSPTSYTSTEGMLTIDNTASINSTTTNGRNVWVMPVAIDLVVTGGSTGTFWAIRMSMDNASAYASGGTTLSAGLTVMDTRTSWTARTPYGKCAFGDLTLTSGTTARTIIGDFPISVGSGSMPVGTRAHLRFGQYYASAGSKDRLSGTAAVAGVYDSVTALPPIWIGRNSSLILQPFASTATDLTFSVYVTTLELGHPRESTT